MEKRDSEESIFAGILSGMFMFACFVGFCMFMFWLTMQCTGYKM